MTGIVDHPVGYPVLPNVGIDAPVLLCAIYVFVLLGL